MQLPSTVVQEMFARHSIDEWNDLLSEAIRLILAGTPADRMRLMQLALPRMDGPLMRLPNVQIHADLEQQFREYCASKSLRPEVLLTGALLEILNVPVAGESATAPDCPAVPAGDSPAAKETATPTAEKNSEGALGNGGRPTCAVCVAIMLAAAAMLAAGITVENWGW